MTSATADPVVSFGPTRFLNRELSWLNFNSRVLAQAEDPDLPLLERVKFCAIYASNLDEFFQVRVAGLKEQVAAEVSRAPADGLSPLGQLTAIRAEVAQQAERLEHVYLDVLRPALRVEGIEILDFDELVDDEAKVAAAEFETRIFPVLTPLAVDVSHPFPYISNLSLSLGVLVDDPEVESLRFARLKVPPSMPRFIETSPDRFVPVEQVIMAHVDQLFPGVELLGAWPFRVTRNADFTVDDQDADDLLEAIEGELRRRRFGRAIRLEVDASMPSAAEDLLKRELEVGEEDVYRCEGLIDPTGLWQLVGLDRPDLKSPTVGGVTPRRLRDLEDGRDFFDRVAQGDVIVHHPYDSFGSTVTEFIRQAAHDPGVLAIKITLYRTSGESEIIDALIGAAERGKQVAVLVELRARFDEEANIGWARRLERRWGPRGVRPRRAQDPHENHAGRSRRGRRGPAVLPRRHRQLQPEDRQALRRLRHPDQRSRGRCRPQPASSTSSPATGGRCGTAAFWSPRTRCAPRWKTLIDGEIEAATNCVGPRRWRRRRSGWSDHPEDEQPRRSGPDRPALRSVDGRRPDRPDRPWHLLSAGGGRGPVRQHHGPQSRRPVPGAQPGVLLRKRRRVRASRASSSGRRI